ncbi:MAG TPA: hypothetical protein VEY12_06330 [Thermoplasmata archaeon]|nr:hypothetical protein [Thermoplasmata archaeon]
MESSRPATASEPPSSPSAPARPRTIRGFLQGPRLVDRRGFWFVLAIFVMVILVFAVAFYAFVTTLKPLATAPVTFAPAYMLGGNGTFNVTSDSNTTWPWTGFSVNLTINNVGTTAVALAPSGGNVTLFIGTSARKDAYHIVWLDRDHNGAVSPGDVFWVTGNGVGLPALSYVQFSLIWRSGGWTATEYFVTSSAIV